MVERRSVIRHQVASVAVPDLFGVSFGVEQDNNYGREVFYEMASAKCQ